MDLKLIGILISIVVIICIVIFAHIRREKQNEIAEKDTKLFLSELSSSLITKVINYLSIMDNVKAIMIDHDLDDFVDSDNYISNVICNDLYETLYSYILTKAEEDADKNLISKYVYKFIYKNKNIADSIVYDYITNVIESDEVKEKIEDVTNTYWKEYAEELDELEDSITDKFADDSKYIEDIENDKNFEYDKPEKEEVSSEDLNPQTDEEIPFDENIDEVVETEEVDYFFDSKGRKRDKKTGRYTK